MIHVGLLHLLQKCFCNHFWFSCDSLALLKLDICDLLSVLNSLVLSFKYSSPVWGISWVSRYIFQPCLWLYLNSLSNKKSILLFIPGIQILYIVLSRSPPWLTNPRGKLPRSYQLFPYLHESTRTRQVLLYWEPCIDCPPWLCKARDDTELT